MCDCAMDKDDEHEDNTVMDNVGVHTSVILIEIRMELNGERAEK